MESMQAPIECTVNDLTFRYPGAKSDAIRRVSFSVKQGEFVLLVGASGSGKSTLLRLLKPELAPTGEQNGIILHCGKESPAPSEVGFVGQDPDSQIVTDRVWHELAFGLENLGLPTDVIRRRVAETASYFGISEWYRRETDTLSGGQKQLLNLAAVTAMQPRLLILDEPTGQLDPIAAADLIATLQRLNRELGLTVIVAEHRLEDLFPIADRVLILENGELRQNGTPREIGHTLLDQAEDNPVRLSMPASVRLFQSLNRDASAACPLTVREGQDFLKEWCGTRRGRLPIAPKPQDKRPVAAEWHSVSFRYERDLSDVLRNNSFRIFGGESVCILGGNGCGKTTLLHLLAGLEKPTRGEIRIFGKRTDRYRDNALYRRTLALLPQLPQTVFACETVEQDLREIPQSLGQSTEESDNRVAAIAQRLGIAHLLDRSPFDLSGGETQLCALAKVLLTEPRLLLLDEPTKGVDAAAKQRLAQILDDLKRDGITVLTVTHDLDFAAHIADRCVLLFDGELLAPDVPSEFFGGNAFYTTAANRIARAICPNAVTCEQVIAFCKGDTP